MRLYTLPKRKCHFFIINFICANIQNFTYRLFETCKLAGMQITTMDKSKILTFSEKVSTISSYVVVW